MAENTWCTQKMAVMMNSAHPSNYLRLHLKQASTRLLHFLKLLKYLVGLVLHSPCKTPTAHSPLLLMQMSHWEQGKQGVELVKLQHVLTRLKLKRLRKDAVLIRFVQNLFLLLFSFGQPSRGLTCAVVGD